MMRILCAVTLFGVNFGGAPALLGAQQFYSHARQMIADQAALELGVLGLPNDPRLINAPIVLDSLGSPAPSISIWRGYVGSESEPPQYLVAAIRGAESPLRLGGFPECLLEELSEAMSRSAPVLSMAAAIDRVRFLVKIADPNGARELLIAADDSTATLTAAHLRKMLPAYWPNDTAVALRTGGYYVRRTVWSHVPQTGYGRPWRLIGYAFTLDQKGTIVAWRQHLGPLTAFADTVLGKTTGWP